MPRKTRTLEEQTLPANNSLSERLAEEIRNARESGQPMIEEVKYPTGKLRVTVIWDAWNPLPMEDRTATILKAYESAEGVGYRRQIALASGLTFPEAYAAGMLPFQIIAALRSSDPVSLDQCREAMIQEGASVLMSADRPQLRFTSLEDAEAAMRRLVQRLPSSDQVWAITQEASAELKLGWSAELG